MIVTGFGYGSASCTITDVLAAVRFGDAQTKTMSMYEFNVLGALSETTIRHVVEINTCLLMTSPMAPRTLNSCLVMMSPHM